MEFLPTFPLQVTTLFFFGFLLFCGALGGYLAHRVPWIPSITGFMLVGLLAGPNGLNLFGFETLERAKIVIDIALALILYRLCCRFERHSQIEYDTSITIHGCTVGVRAYRVPLQIQTGANSSRLAALDSGSILLDTHCS